MNAAIVALLAIFTMISIVCEFRAYPALAPWRTTLTEYMVRGPFANLQRGAYVALILATLALLTFPTATFERAWYAALIVSAAGLVGVMATANLAVDATHMTLGRTTHIICAGLAFTAGFAAQAAYFGTSPRILIVVGAIVTTFLLVRFRLHTTAGEEKLALAWLLAGTFVIALFP